MCKKFYEEIEDIFLSIFSYFEKSDRRVPYPEKGQKILFS